MVKSLKIVEGGGGAEVEDRGEGVAEDEVIICAGGGVRRGEDGRERRGGRTAGRASWSHGRRRVKGRAW